MVLLSHPMFITGLHIISYMAISEHAVLKRGKIAAKVRKEKFYKHSLVECERSIPVL